MATATLTGHSVPALKVFPAGAAEHVFRGTRMPVSAVFENLQDMNVEELTEEFGVTQEPVQGSLQFVAHSTKAPVTCH